MSDDNLWKTKLHARLHDPAEKALVLLRDPAGHENGTSRILRRIANANVLTSEKLDNDNSDVLHAVAFSDGIESSIYEKVKQADWWAAAADRPQFPLQEITVTTKKGEEKVLSVSNWAQVNWAKKPVLIHPLTGEQFDLGQFGGLSDTDFTKIKGDVFSHFSKLLIRNSNGVTDFKKSALAFWRFGPEVKDDADNDKLGVLWHLLPADTRIPDHSIWDHLDLTSAFAGAFAADPNGDAALLTLSIGPVQSFIAAARTTSDLWAGSHLLSRLSWEAMRPVCEQLGPDAILFPRLRGIPQVDLWLWDQMDLPETLFKDCDWNKGGTDFNPLFSASLPNRFVAVVPASKAKEIAELVEKSVRTWLQNLGEKVVTELLTIAGYQGEQENISTPYEQMKEQLKDFPEVHWAAVPFSLIRCGDTANQRNLDTTMLSDSMKPFFGENDRPGFLDSDAWKILQKDLELTDDDGKKYRFFSPNPGVLYPAVFELAERALAAAKACRTFTQTKQEGWRCSLTGENEWLTTDREQLHWNQKYRNKQGTLWTAIAAKKPSLAKKGEHLSALPAIKRLWPTLFLEEVKQSLDDESVKRFVVSTHTMALAGQLMDKLAAGIPDALREKVKDKSRVALPRKLAKAAGKNADLIARIPGWLEDARDMDDNGKALEDAQKTIKELFNTRAETYYGLLMMDGDCMGAILSGDDKTSITYLESFHPHVQKGFKEKAEKQRQLNDYANQKRAISPNRHLTISGALNDFSQTVVRHIVEEEYLGRVIYAGGDDVLAMLPVTDLLEAMQRLRYAYSGFPVPNDQNQKELVVKNGFAILKGKLMRMMGKNATASCGAVIAHHQAPLSAVLRELRNAEKRAKNSGRDRFSLTLIKRSGGALQLTEQWGEPVALLIALRKFLAMEGVSRRAAYNVLQWLDAKSFPALNGDGEMLKTLLTYQFNRQVKANAADAKKQIPSLAEKLTELTLKQREEERISWLRNFLSVAEFLARDIRTGGDA